MSDLTKSELTKLSRDELNTVATAAGIGDPDSFKSKDDLADAVLARSAANATSDATASPDADPLPAEEGAPSASNWDVIGEDGRRIVRNVAKPMADNEAARISSATGEKLRVVEADPFVLGPTAADTDQPAEGT